MFELENGLICSPEIYQKAIAFIKAAESLRLTAYLDKNKNGVWTIGWGSTHDVREGLVITLEQAEVRLIDDFTTRAVRPVSRLLKVVLKDNQMAALYSLVFNIGEGHFAASTLLKKLNDNVSIEECSEEFPRWKYDDGVEEAGLVARREKEKELFLS